MNNEHIMTAVRNGMESASKDARMMNLYSGAKLYVEYLATVSIGQALVRSKHFNYGDQEIHFEYSTKKFLTSTVPLIKKSQPLPGHVFGKHILRKLSNTTRNGRIDIALMSTNNNGCSFPLCAIEVKGNNPSKNLLVKDLKRNLECMVHSGVTGNSNLKLTLSCSFYSYVRDPNCVTEAHEEIFREKVKDIYEKR